jgi:hypothetical protein
VGVEEVGDGARGVWSRLRLEVLVQDCSWTRSSADFAFHRYEKWPAAMAATRCMNRNRLGFLHLVADNEGSGGAVERRRTMEAGHAGAGIGSMGVEGGGRLRYDVVGTRVSVNGCWTGSLMDGVARWGTSEDRDVIFVVGDVVAQASPNVSDV